MENEDINFQFRSPKLIFGRKTYLKIPEICAQYGNKGLFICGNSFKDDLEYFNQLESAFKNNEIEVIKKIRESGEPSVNEVDILVNFAKKEEISWVLGIGGGSVLDLAKAIAGLATNEGSAADYQSGKVIQNIALPFIAAPTTAGTGSEITNNSVLIDTKNEVKKSIRGDSMLAKVAVLDPLLTISMPPAITANTGMDALTQAIESFVSKASNTLSDYYAKQAIEYLWNNIEKVYLNGNDIDSREKMLYGSTLSALSFSNAKLGAVHGFAHPIGVIHSISHGLICGVLLPYVMKFNLDGDLPQVIKKFSWIAQIMDGSIDSEPNKKSASYAIESIFNLLKNLHMPSTLSELNINTDHIPRIVNETKGSSLANNPRNTDKVSLTKILENAL